MARHLKRGRDAEARAEDDAKVRATVEGILADIAARYDLILVSDEVHADLTYAPARHIPLAPLAPERTVTLNAASKAFNVAGLRIAVCVAPPALRKRLSALPSTRWNAFSTLGLGLGLFSPELQSLDRRLLAIQKSCRLLDAHAPAPEGLSGGSGE